MEVTLQIHLEAADEAIIWWAESDELPGLSAAADSLPELRELLDQALIEMSADIGESITIVSERLAEAEDSESIEVPSADQIEMPITAPFGNSRQVLVSV